MWFAKFILKLKWRLARLLEIKPFLRIDENAYCPACGNCKGKISSISDDKTVAVLHQCGVCGWRWMERTVTDISRDAISQVWQLTSDEGDEDAQTAKVANA